MSVSPGSRLGHYEIVAPLGAGGMGEVFRARDTRLGREVALKLVLEVFLNDHDRLVRFEREARTLAALNHPGIATLHGFEQATPPGAASPVHFLVMELVEGERLTDRIARGLTLEESISIARQMAEALEAAHEKGIIHRDLKPANVKVTPDDKVKVLDFGLAKAMDWAGEAGRAGRAGGGQAAEDEAGIRTVTSPAMTTVKGMILGTAAYMSPEQARGVPVDHRSDIFSFGIVVYEMLTGRKPFIGETVSDVLASVLAREPDLTALPHDLSPRLVDLLRRCLEKLPRRRWQAIGDVRHELEIIAAHPRATATPATAFAPRPLWKQAMPAVVAAAIASAITGGVLWTMRPAATPAMITRFPLALGDKQTFTNLGRPAIGVSPDGTRIGYIASNTVYVRAMSDLTASAVVTAAGMTNIAFSPDGRSIAYWQPGQIKTVEIAGRAVVTVCAALDSPGGISWSGTSLYFSQPRAILRVPASGGQPEVIVPLEYEESAFRPQMLPDGKTVLFTLASGSDPDRWDRAKVVLHSLDTGTRTTLVEGGSDARYVPSGHLLYAVSGVLFARPFDVSRRALTGGAVAVVEGVRRGGGGVGAGTVHFGVSDTGTLSYLPGPVVATGALNQQLALFDRSGAYELLKVPMGTWLAPRVSPDGRFVAFGREDSREVSVWVYALSGAGSPRRLTFRGQDRYPLWTADSRRVIFQSTRDGEAALFWQRADGTGAPEHLTTPAKGVSHFAHSVSPDGAVVLVDQSAESKTTLMALSLKDRTLTPFGGVESAMRTGAAFSPDGRWVAYSTRQAAGDPSILYVQPFPATGARSQVSTDSEDGHHPAWSPDGKELFYTPGDGPRLTAVSISTRQGFDFSGARDVSRPFMNAPTVSQRPYDIARDGKRFLGLLLTDGGGPASPTIHIQVVLNWFEELRARAPVK